MEELPARSCQPGAAMAWWYLLTLLWCSLLAHGSLVLISRGLRNAKFLYCSHTTFQEGKMTSYWVEVAICRLLPTTPAKDWGVSQTLCEGRWPSHWECITWCPFRNALLRVTCLGSFFLTAMMEVGKFYCSVISGRPIFRQASESKGKKTKETSRACFENLCCLHFKISRIKPTK